MKKIFLYLLFFMISAKIFAQSTLITPGTNQPNIIANGTNNGGITPPRMTNAQIAAIVSPNIGSMVYDTDVNCLRIFDGTKWKCQSVAQSVYDYSANSMGGVGNQIPYDIEIVGDYIYVAGEFEGEIYFVDDYGPVVLYSAGGKDGFLAKLRKDGRLEWARQISNTAQCIANQVKLDGNGNVYVAGTHKGAVTVGSINLGNSSTTTNDIFFAKYNNSGAFQWVQKIGGTVEDSLAAMAIDGNNNIHLTGMFEGTTALLTTNGGVGVILTAGSCTDLFYAKYSTSGAFLHHKVGTSSECLSGTALTVDQYNNVYLAGSSVGLPVALTFDGITLPLSSASAGGFVTKISPSNFTFYVKNAGVYWPSALAVDNSNNLYLTSNNTIASYNTPFGAITVKFPQFTLVKFDNLLDILWSIPSVNLSDAYSPFAGTATPSTCQATNEILNAKAISDITISNNSTIQITGVFFCSVAFNINSVHNLNIDFGRDSRNKQTNGKFNAIFLEYSLDGGLLYLDDFGGTGMDGINAIKATSNGETFAVGYYENTVNWTYGQSTTSLGAKDMFLLKISK